MHKYAQKSCFAEVCFLVLFAVILFPANRKIISSEQEIIFAKKRLLGQDKKHRNFYAKTVNQNQKKIPHFFKKAKM